MTFYEMTRPEEQKSSLFQAIQSRLSGMVHAMQYAQMLQALNALNDTQLDQIGLERKDIPQHAHECIYGE